MQPSCERPVQWQLPAVDNTRPQHIKHTGNMRSDTPHMLIKVIILNVLPDVFLEYAIIYSVSSISIFRIDLVA